MRWNLPDTNCPQPGSTSSRCARADRAAPAHPPPASLSARRPGAPFPHALIAQEMTTEPTVEIPERSSTPAPVWRPRRRPGHRLERPWHAGADLHKDESVSPAGSHKPNTAVSAGFYNRRGRRPRSRPRPAANGARLSFACAFYGLECKVYMVRARTSRNPTGASWMETWGGRVVRARWTSPVTPARGRCIAMPCATPSPADTITRSGRCSTTCSCTRPSSARSHGAAGMAGEERPMWSSVLGGGSNLAGSPCPLSRPRVRLLAVERHPARP